VPRPKSTISKTNGNGAKTSNGAKLGFEEILWTAADKQRGHMDAAEYKHVVLGLIFLKYISDAFNELYQKLEQKSTLTRKNGTSTLLRISSGFPKRRGGRICRRMPNSLLSVSYSMRRWMRSRKRTRPLKEYCLKNMVSLL
jgi:type I restriction enzyme M protein